MPTVVAGLHGIGRGQDRHALMEFVATVAQSMGPEALAQYIIPTEFLNRLAAASGIEALGLIKTPEQLSQEQEQAQQQAQQQEILSQAGQLANTPIAEQFAQQIDEQQNQQPTPPAEGEEL